jgi:hypothetical protein
LTILAPFSLCCELKNFEKLCSMPLTEIADLLSSSTKLAINPILSYIKRSIQTLFLFLFKVHFKAIYEYIEAVNINSRPSTLKMNLLCSFEMLGRYPYTRLPQ